MYLLIIILPLLGAVFSGFGGRWLGVYGSTLVSTLCVLISSCFSVLIFYEVGFSGSFSYVILTTWIECGLLKVNWGFLFDSLTAVMLFVVTFISSLVHLYSIKYMESDPHVPRFMAYLSLFTFFMLVLVSSDNLLQMFLGWEGVGLVSYLLINFWFTRLNANQSAIKALLVNRVGDYSLSLSIFSTFFVFKSLDYSIIFSCVPFFLDHWFYILNVKCHSLIYITLLLFIGSIGKSAQLGLHTWLPDAMEGPTPVSALIHAATMVTAGIFLITRFSYMLEYSLFTLFLLVLFGGLTALFGSVTGMFQNDLKRVIAYSTCSQLGYMIFACGLSCYDASMFHLVNHAFFKALLFLAAGSVIHTVFDEQDMRRMGSLIKILPLTYSLVVIGSLSLIGFPFLAGFYSKDFIIELSWLTTFTNLYLSYGLFSCWLITLSALFTSFYSFRLLYLTFIASVNLSYSSIKYVSESSINLLFPLIFLALCSIFIGYWVKDLFIGFGSSFWGSSILVLVNHSNVLEGEWIDFSLKLLPFVISIFGIGLAYFLNNYFKFILNKWAFFLVFFFVKKWYWDKLLNTLILLPLIKSGYYIFFKILDKGFIELLGPYVLPRFTLIWSMLFTKFQTGKITDYIFFMTIGILFFINFITFSSLFSFKADIYLSVLCLLLLLFL